MEQLLTQLKQARIREVYRDWICQHIFETCPSDAGHTSYSGYADDRKRTVTDDISFDPTTFNAASDDPSPEERELNTLLADCGMDWIQYVDSW